MNFILFDDYSWQNLLPLTFTRPVADLRVGILKIKEKWEHYLKSPVSYLTQDYLSVKFILKETDDNILINGSILPDTDLLKSIINLGKGEVLTTEDIIIAARTESVKGLPGDVRFEDFISVPYGRDFIKINFPWDIFRLSGEAILTDFGLIVPGRESFPLSNTNKILNHVKIFTDEGVKAEAAIFNAETGPIFLGRNAEVMEGSMIRGPFALGENSVLKMGARVYGPTTIGPNSKVGGEVNNSVFQGFSNKAHDGFLGNSVIGEWCNIGADSNNSNLKNNYAEVKLWNYREERFINTGLTFCGLIMGDHSKCGINTMFNTGTVVGVNANIFGTGFPRNFIPSFSWGGPHGFTEYNPEKAFEVAREVMSRRNIEFDDTERSILQAVFDMTKKYRK